MLEMRRRKRRAMPRCAQPRGHDFCASHQLRDIEKTQRTFFEQNIARVELEAGGLVLVLVDSMGHTFGEQDVKSLNIQCCWL